MSSKSRWQFGTHLMLFYTHRTRRSAEILTEQKRDTAKNRSTLEAMLPLVDRIRDALVAGNYDAVGYALHEGWMLKRELASKVSDSQIDEIYNRAIQAGALGGKIAGAGGGGFLLLYVPPANQDHVRNALSDLRELPFLPENDGSKVIFNQKRYSFK